MTQNRLPSWLWISVALTAILCCYSVAQRHRVEASNKATTLAAEYEVVESLATAQGITAEQGLRDLAAQGIKGAVISEEIVAEMISQGRATLAVEYAKTSPIVKAMGLKHCSVLTVASLADVPRLQVSMKVRYHQLVDKMTVDGAKVYIPNVEPSVLKTTSLGLNPTQVATVKRVGDIIIGRYSNPLGVSSQTATEMIRWAKSQGVSLFLPQGDQVLGRRESTEAVLTALRETGIHYASPEFAKIGGDTEMVEKGQDIVVRLHSAQAAELDKLSPVDAVDRYVKAARERQQHVLLLRPISYGSDKPLASFAEFGRDINRKLVEQGCAIGQPKPFRDSGLPKSFFALLGLVAAPAIWFVGTVFFSNRTLQMVGAVGIALLGAASIIKTGQQLMALTGSMAFPILGFVLFDRLKIKSVFAGYALISVFSVLGGLFVAGMLNGLPYFVKAAEFPMVKLSVFLPIVLVGLYFWMGLTDWKTALKDPITWGKAALGLAIMAALVLMLARTGNDSGVGASGGEMAFRNLLDRILYVRPRTKEFMIGHPMLIVALGLLVRYSKKSGQNQSAAGWIALLLMLGAIGQTSIVNTMCHLHIPVLLSIARAIEGIVIGCILGAVLWVAIQRLAFAKER